MFVCLCPIMVMRDFSPSNELRYLNIADEAISGGHVFAFTNQGEPYSDKPPLYFWLVMLSRLIFGEHSMFALALWSFIPACVIIWVMDRWVMSHRSSKERLAMAFMMGSTALFLGMSVFLRMDMLMVMFDVLALYAFSKGRRCQFALYTFLSLFTKGPVGLLVPPLTVVVYLLVRRLMARKGVDVGPAYGATVEGSVRCVGGRGFVGVSSASQGGQCPVGSERSEDIVLRFGYWFGWRFWVILGGACALWFTGVYLDGGASYLNDLLFKQTAGRAVNSFHHAEPAWYYLTNIWYLMAPWAFLSVGALIASICSLFTRGRSSKGLAMREASSGESAAESKRPPIGESELLFDCMIVMTFVMLSCFSAKLGIYLAPIFPFAVYLVPMVVDRLGWHRVYSYLVGVPMGVIALAGLAVVIAVAIWPLIPALEPFSWARGVLTLLAGAVLAAGSVLAIVAVRRATRRAQGAPNKERLEAQPRAESPEYGDGSLTGGFQVADRTDGLVSGGLSAAIPFALGLLLFALLLSPKMPQINDYIGYGNLCRDIPSGQTVYVRKVHRPENMNVYLGRDVVVVGVDDPIPTDGVLVTRASFEDPALATRRKVIHGDYALYLPQE